MSALSAAEARASGALQRLERALSARSGHGVADDQATIERDCELLRQECDALRRDLDAANQRSERLTSIVAEVEGRIDGAIERVDDLAGSGATP
jgi:SMC interacting uncharacterized protein involved in chromosome segregation